MNNCKLCSNEIESTLTFCSMACSAKFNNKGARRHGKERFCINCGLKIKSKKFCSNKCQSTHKWVAEKRKILENGFCSSVALSKRYLIETRGRICEICKSSEWMGQAIPLVKDHIDGNSENNLLSNLRLICCNCDAQTTTYKGRNRGRGRAYRRQRYAQGKSF